MATRSAVVAPTERAAVAREALLRRLAYGGAGIGMRLPPIPHSDPAAAPLSFHQRGILETLTLFDGLYRDVPFRNQHVELHLQGRLDHAALVWALAQIGSRHGALRTTFPALADDHGVSIASNIAVDLPVEDLSALGTVHALEEIRRRCRAEAARPMDHETGPLIVYRLLRAASDLHVLWLLVDHLLFDGWSFGILLRELEAFYRARTMGRNLSLPMPFQQAELAAWDADRFANGQAAAGIAYWTGQLAAAPAIVELATDRPRRTPQPFSLGSLEMAIDPAIAKTAQALSRGMGVPMFAVLYAGYAAFLHAKTGQTDISIVSAMANRARPETQQVIGGLTNGVVLRSTIDALGTFAQLIADAQRITTQAIVHQDIPVGPLLDQLHPGSDFLRTYFALQNYPIPRLDLPDLTVSSHDMRFGSTLWDLTIALIPRDAALAGVICYNAELFDQPTVERLMTDYAALLTIAIDQPDAPLTAVIAQAGMSRP